MRLHPVLLPGRGADRAAEDDVVRKDDIGREMLPQGFGVRIDEVAPLGPREILDTTGLQILVPVDHEHRQDSPDVGSDDACAPEVELLGVRILGEDRNVVAEP
jgi:hypothetical protein